MAYQPYDRNQSGIVFFGTTASDQVFESNSNFIIDTANSRALIPNITLSNNGVIGSASQTGILTLGSDGVATFLSGVIIGGDLTVQGNQVILNTETLNIEDNIIVLNANVSSTPTLDAGIEVERGTSANVRILWDEGNDRWDFTNNGTNYYRISSNSILMAGSGLVDGGIQEESRVLHVGAGTGIVVTDNKVHVGPGLISDRTTITSVDGSGDFLLIWDATDSTLKKVNRQNFVDGLGTMSSFSISDGSVTESISDGQTINFVDSPTINLSVLATDTVSGALVTNSVSESYLTASVAGSGIIGGNGTPLHINFDNSTLEVSSDILTIKNAGVTEAKISRSIASINSPTTISSDINLVTGGSGGVTVTLPSPISGKMVIVKKVDSGAGTVIVSGGDATIDGASTKILYYQYETMTFVSDGTNWFVV